MMLPYNTTFCPESQRYHSYGTNMVQAINNVTTFTAMCTSI